MGYRVNKVSVWCGINVEFLGPLSLNFEFVPNPDDPTDKALVEALLKKNDQINLAAAKLAGQAEPLEPA